MSCTLRLLNNLGITITPVSLKLWKSRGRISDHSIDDDIFCLAKTDRWEEKASHRIKIKNIRAVNERSDPIDETTFHFINASG